MFKVSRKLLLSVLMICVLVQAPFIFATVNPTVKNPIVCKLGYTDNSTVKISDSKEIVTPGWAGMAAFKSALEKYSQGKVKVELFSNGRLGDNKSMIEQVLMGNLLVAAPPDGAIAPFYKEIQVLNIPYLLEDYETVAKVVDGPFGRKLFNDMAAKSGIRVLSWYAEGARSFANNKRVLKVPADMKGLKIRTMDSPVYMELVKACGAAPIPVAWMELYSALQTGVVDGMENAPVTILQASLHEVLKYYTLNKHVLFSAGIITNEKFLKSLPADLQKAFVKAGKDAAVASRAAANSCESVALERMKESGVNIYVPTAAEKKLWKKTQEPTLKWFRENINPKLVNELINAVKKVSKEKNN
jgi:tripartite ATP-independent transporter DctP family solute receptor